MKARGSTLFRHLLAVCIISLILSPVSATAEETYKFERLWPTLQQPWYFGDAEGISVDNDGFVYVADMYSHCIRKFTSDGRFVTRWGGYGKENGKFDAPTQVAIDNANNCLYVVEKYNHRVQKFSLDGKFLGAWGKYGSGEGEFSFPQRIVVGKDGSVYVSDSRNYRIQKFDSDGEFLLRWGIKGNEDGEFLAPRGIAIDSEGSVYVADSETNCVQKFTKNGEFLFKWCGSKEDEGGPLDAPNGIAIHKGYVYVVNEGNGTVQKFRLEENSATFVTKWGGESRINSVKERIDELIEDYLAHIETYRMNFQALKDLANYLPVSVENGEFKSPRDIAIDNNGFVYVADTGNQRIQKFDSDGTFLSKWTGINNKDGTFQSPLGIAVYKDEFIYVADSGNHRIQKFRRSDGKLVANWGKEGSGEATTKDTVEFEFPADIAVDKYGNVYVADTLNHRIQKFGPDGTPLGVWGKNAINEDGELELGPDNFLIPVGITVHDDYAYVSDLGTNRIHKFDLNKTPAEGTVWKAQSPVRVAVDKAGNVYSVNQDCNCVQKFSSDGTRFQDWKIELAKESETTGPAIEYSGLTIQYEPAEDPAEPGKEYLYVSTGEYNYCIWKFLLEDDKATFVTQISEPGHEIGQVTFPGGIDVDENGRIYVADTGNHRIQVFRKGQDSDEKMKAIIVAGRKSESDDLWRLGITQASANFAYRALIYQGFTAETIYYLSSDTGLDLTGNGELDVDAPATKSDLRNLILSEELAEGVNDVVLYLVDHGGKGTFHINENETLSVSDEPDELDNWLNELQNKISGKLIVVYEACHSGSFLPYLKPSADKKRIVITSASAEESAWFHAEGSVSFSNYFWTEIFNGSNLEYAFVTAKAATESTIEGQHALMDDSNDGEVARNTYIGNRTIVSGEAPVITSLPPKEQELSETNSKSLLYAEVTDPDNDEIDRVWAVIRPPNYVPSEDDYGIHLPSVDLKPVGNNRYEEDKENYYKFDVPGTYLIAVYAKDAAGNTSSPPELIKVKVKVEDISRRKAIIVVGDSASDEIRTVLTGLGQFAYNALRDQGYDDDDNDNSGADTDEDNIYDDIYFMSPITSSGVYGAPSFESFEHAVSTWAADARDVVLYMVGEGTASEDGVRDFRINDLGETLSAKVLDEWLDSLQADKIPGKVTLIYDSCNSESFLSLLSPPDGKERILIGSSGENQPAYFISDGKLSFSKYFWRSVSDGVTVDEAFIAAKNSIGRIDKQNKPQINDKELAANYFIGAGIMRADSKMLIKSVSPNQTLSDDGTPTIIWAKHAVGRRSISKVWAVLDSIRMAMSMERCVALRHWTRQSLYMTKQRKDMNVK